MKKEEKKKDTKKKDFKLDEQTLQRDPAPQREYLRNNYGVACFYLNELLLPNVRNLKLQAPIVPKKKFEDLESNNLDLNTSAKKDFKKQILSCNYLENVSNFSFTYQNSFLICGFNLAFELGTFKPPQKPVETQPIIDPKA